MRQQRIRGEASMAGNDIRTLGYVLRRTNYGEADRILNVITPSGKMVVMAKGVRKPRSKLAGGVEMFTLSDLNIHVGRGEFGTLTGAKMLRYYDKIVGSLERMELAAVILRRVARASESSDNPEFFTIVDQSLMALNGGASLAVVETWFWFNLAKASGEEVNLYRDVSGEVLLEGGRYAWDSYEGALALNENGKISGAEIKLMRLFVTAELAVILRVKGAAEMVGEILPIARGINKT